MTHTNDIVLNLNQACKSFQLCLFPKSTKHREEKDQSIYLSIYTIRPRHGIVLSLPKLETFFWYQSRVIGLSIHSLSAAILPEPRPVILPKEFTADNPLKLLLPSLTFRDLLVFRSFEEWRSESVSSFFVALIACNCTMLLLQNGHTGSGGLVVVGFGLLWQHKASTQCAHIWCPQSWTSIVHN